MRVKRNHFDNVRMVAFWYKDVRVEKKRKMERNEKQGNTEKGIIK